MFISLPQLLLLIVAYLSSLFAVGYAADRGVIPQRILNHPLVYVLSLGVFTGPLAVFGATELAFNYGYSFLLYYLGVVAMFFLAPLLLAPVLRVCRIYQLKSLADLLTFRFRSSSVGTLVTLAMLLAMLPMLALQIQAVSDAAQILFTSSDFHTANQRRQDGLAILFCTIIAAFTMLFGTRHVTAQQRHNGLVAAIALESLVKLLALILVGLGAVYSLFGGFAEMNDWLLANPHIIELLDSPLRQDSSRALLLIFFAGAIAMPHMFHMTFTENPGSGALRVASWGLPLYLLLISLPILPITWAGLKLEGSLPIAYSALAVGLSQNSALLTTAAFVAGLSAASAIIIVSTLALANMCLNHLILPVQLQATGRHFDVAPEIYQQLRWLRRVVISAIILAGYLFYHFLAEGQSLMDLGLVAFVGTLQFLPGILATIYWPGANRKGLLMGLLGGFLTWFFTLLLPLVSDFDPQFIRYLYLIWFDDVESIWSAATICSLGINMLLFLLVSVLTKTSPGERQAAEICSMDDLNRPLRQTLTLHSPHEFKHQLSTELGESTASAEVDQALTDLQLESNESRPYALRRLRARIEANLSGMLGPTVAHQILQRCIPFQLDGPRGAEDISLIEQRLDDSQVRFTGLAADLDNLRRYHRDTLQELPIGVFSLGHDEEVLMWNRFMEHITGVSADAVVGSYLTALPPAWTSLLQKFARSEEAAELRLNLASANHPGKASPGRWISLHKTTVVSSSRETEDKVIVVEDITDYQMLEQELLHSERLASIGRLAAGVAHEVGNPITGIACLAQNLEYEEDLTEVQETAREILKQTGRVTRIVESLVNFSHSGNGTIEATQLVPLNMADCVDEAIHLLELDHSAKPVRFDNRCDREHLVLADGQKLLQVFINLLSNARDASEEQQPITIASAIHNSQVHIAVSDLGCGIPEDVQGQIFEPFFTTKEPGQGTGLGLSVVYSILEDLGGRILLASPPAGASVGTCFTVQLERAEYPQEYL
ncbi:MAG: ATP-binding protein [Gammaproteobacteria bacterium]|nr:ATP-binding protein [Gammaproteobacteria bacterium]